MKDLYKDISSVTKTVDEVVNSTERVIVPVRQSLFKRFPIISVLLVTCGVSATFFGIERMIMEVGWLNERPYLIFFFGVCILAVSGKLYQKLG